MYIFLMIAVEWEIFSQSFLYQPLFSVHIAQFFVSADNLRELIHMSKEFDVKFVYAISPGLDMTLSSGSEVNLLKKKLDQVSGTGGESAISDLDLFLCFTSHSTVMVILQWVVVVEPVHTSWSRFISVNHWA